MRRCPLRNERCCGVVAGLAGGRHPCDAIHGGGHQIALVGGSVRDALLGRLQQDLDFATDARPEQILAIVRPWANNVWETGIAYGTVGLRKGDYILEITTYRSDAYDPASRKPAVTYGDTPRATSLAVTSPSTRWRCGCPRGSSSTRTAVCATSASASSARPVHRRTPSATTRCGWCGRLDSRPSSASTSHLEVVAAMRAMADRIDIVPADAFVTNSSSC